MKPILILSFVSACWSFAVPLQEPLRIQEEVEKLSWTDSHCTPTSDGKNSICIQVPPPPFDQVRDPVVLGPIQYCGYITTKKGARTTQMFFWLVMSETTDPTTSPLVVWMNGGPGVSSLLGLWDQWGPRLFDYDHWGNTPTPSLVKYLTNPDRLTEKMSWIFLEQPAGVGFSKTTSQVTNSDKGAADILDFLKGIKLTATFNYQGNVISLKNAPLHIAGESYAGHYIPALGSLLVSSGQAKPLKLTSIFLGNGLVDANLLGDGVSDLLCSSPPLMTLTPKPTTLDDRCQKQPDRIIKCKAAIDKCRKKTARNPAACDTVIATCWLALGFNWARDFGLNPYDLSRSIRADQAETDFYEGPLVWFMNDVTRKALYKVDSSVTWAWVNDAMNGAFQHSGDWFRNYYPEIGNILKAGIDFMIYVGDTDLVVPWPAVKKGASTINWTVSERNKFRSCLSKPEASYKTIARPGASTYGSYVRSGHLNYVRVFGSGHMINENRPADSKHLFETWVFNRPAFGECVP